MRRSRFTEEQIIAVLKEAETWQAVKDVCRRDGRHMIPEVFGAIVVALFDHLSQDGSDNLETVAIRRVDLQLGGFLHPARKLR